jgi:hypothetical protein
MMKRTVLFLIAGLVLLAPASAIEGFDFFDPEPTGNTEPLFSLGGSAYVDLAVFVDDGSVRSTQSVTLDLEREGFASSLEFVATSGDSVAVSSLSISLFGPRYRFEAGLLSKEWGSGDGVHVVDITNVADYRQGIVDDLQSMKMAEPMALLSFFRDDTAVDLLFKPIFTPMQTATEGRWSLVPESFLSATVLYPETDTLSWAQFGLRVKTVIGPIDGSLIYFNGYYPQPGYGEIVLDFSDPLSPYVESASVVHTRARLFAGAVTAIWGPVSLMAEGGYWLSEDTEGTDPALYNSRWVYLAGIGMTVPGTQAYVSLAYTGETVANLEAASEEAFDVDGIGRQEVDAVTVAMDLPFAKRQGTLTVAGIYRIRTHGYALLPSIAWNFDDNIALTAKGRVIGSFGDDSSDIFGIWEENDSLTLGLTCLF